MNGRMRTKRLLLLALTLVLATVLGTAGVSYAIINGEADGDRHPYVAAVGGLSNGEMFLCSAAAISPRILVTAAHCFETWASLYLLHLTLMVLRGPILKSSLDCGSPIVIFVLDANQALSSTRTMWQWLYWISVFPCLNMPNCRRRAWLIPWPWEPK